MSINTETLLFLCVLLLPARQMLAQATNETKTYKMTSITSKGVPAPKENFTGNVWLNQVVKPEDNLNSVIAKVSFEPTARTNWHNHPHGQILIVTEGTGYYQEKGKPIQVIKEGDVIKISANAEHWHGASHNSAMTHIAIVPTDKTGSIWLRPVTEEEYNAIQAGNR